MPKSKVIVQPFTIVIDNREQMPWLFEKMEIGTGRSKKPVHATTIGGTLKCGDYSIQGHEHLISIERKSKQDLFGTLSQGRARFIRELARLNELQFAAVVIESSWESCMLEPPERSKMTPSSVNGSIVAFQQRFPGVHWWWMPGRYAASKQAWKILHRYWQDHCEAQAETQQQGVAI